MIAPWKPGPAELPRRVHDLAQGHFGTAVEYVAFSARGHFYRVEWDDPTPHQDTATPLIPSQHFEWAEPARRCGPERQPKTPEEWAEWGRWGAQDERLGR